MSDTGFMVHQHRKSLFEYFVEEGSKIETGKIYAHSAENPLFSQTFAENFEGKLVSVSTFV